MQASPTLAQVALPLALPHPLLYEIPPSLRGQVQCGHRVAVPLRGTRAHGIVVGLTGASAKSAGMSLRPLEGLDPADVLLAPALLSLVRWVSRYYAAPIGIACETAVPRVVARPPRSASTAQSGARGDGQPIAQEDAQSGGRKAGGPDAPEGGADTRPPGTPLSLNPAQAAALAPVVAALEAGVNRTFLLQGVTGSGKTEVYLQAVATALERGRTALFLVPEIALGTQVMARVRERFGDQVAEYHSQLTPGTRRRAWWQAHAGRARVVVGARSAVFVPLRDLGLIVIDEEHEPSYKQSETPRYHGRDTALMRARLEGAVTLMGSATPSLESRRNVEQEKYVRLHLPERIAARPTPRVTLVDLRSKQEGAAPSIGGLDVVGTGDADRGEPLSAYLRERLQAVIAAGDQAILFLNRRGFSTAVQCRDCGYVFECPHCSVVLTFHRKRRLLRCHYCNHELREIRACPECAGHDFAYTGVGTQRVEAALAEQLPEARVLRMDLDSTRRRGALATMIADFERGAADVLLGTQMVAKGFDFPRVTLVGVINADREMGLPDFRAQERAFQLLTQVAGRAGRGNKPGEVVFQTYQPEHHVITAAGHQDYEAFYQRELAERQSLRYVPFRRMANLLFDGPDEAEVTRVAEAVAQRLTGRSGVELLGPAPMPLSRLKGQYRWHLTLLAGRPGLLTALLHDVLAAQWARRGRPRVRIQADMDPASML